MKQTGLIGDIGETILITELKIRGLSVAIPFGHLDPYDLIVVNSRGTTFKVQVKTCSSPNGNSYRFSGVKNFELNDIYGFLMLDRWVFLTSQQVKKMATANGLLRLNTKKQKKFDNFDIFL